MLFGLAMPIIGTIALFGAGPGAGLPFIERLGIFIGCIVVFPIVMWVGGAFLE